MRRNATAIRMLFRQEPSLGFVEFTLPLPLSNHGNMKCVILILSQRGSLSLFGIWLLYLLNSIYAQAPCYYLNGKLQTADTPCNPGELHSMCCNRNDICLSNGLCFTTRINGLSRGSCTDQSWRSESCSTICRNEYTYGGAEIYLCPNSTPSKWYCGSSNAGRCTSNTSNSTFSLPQGFFSDFRDYRCIATTSNPTSCSIQSLTPPKSADTSTSTANSPSSTPSLLQACQTSSALPASACANSKNTEIGIGVGVGIPLFVALVASLLFLFRERRLRKQLAIEPGVSNERGHFPSSKLQSTWFSTEPKVPASPVFEVEAGPVPTTAPVEMAPNSRGGRS